MSTSINTTLPQKMLSYVTGMGVELPDVSTVRSDVIEEMKVSLGLGNDWNYTTETILGRLVEAITIHRMGVLGVNAYVAQQTNVFKATGTFLDGLGALFLRNRSAGIVAKVRVRIVVDPNKVDYNYATKQATFKEGYELKKGTSFISTDGSKFVLPNTYTACQRELVAGSGETAEYEYVIYALVESIDTGTKDEKGTDINSYTDTTGIIQGVTVQSVVSYGAEDESDEHYRRRLIASRWTGKSFCESLSAELATLAGVKSFCVLENVTNTPKATPHSIGTKKEYLLSPHSVMITVDGGDGDEIARSIFRTKSVGSTMCRCDETIATTITPPYYKLVTDGTRSDHVHEKIVVDSVFGKAHTIIYNTPVVVPVSIRMTIGRNLYTRDDDELKQDLMDAVDAWAADQIESVEGLRVGESIYAEEIASAISEQIPEIKVKAIRICITPGDGVDPSSYDWASSVEIMEWEVGSIASENMVVNIE